MACVVNGTEIILSGWVGVRDLWVDDGFSYDQVVMALAATGRDANVKIRLNSGGGIATDGAAIHALLKAHKGRVDIIVDGIAASAASLIAMAGRLTMSAGSLLMIHNPSTWTAGGLVEHERSIAELKALSNAYAGVYAEKSGKTAADVHALMDAETWMTADEAIEAGFADKTLATAATTDITPAPYAAYAHAPQAMVAMAAAKGWTPERFKAAPAAPPAHKETSMSATKPADKTPATTETTSPEAIAAARDEAARAAVTEDRARRAAIMALAEAKGCEALAEHLWSTGSTVEAAKATLAAAPKPAAAPDYEATRQPIAGGLTAPVASQKAGTKDAFKAAIASAVARINKR